MKDYYEILGVEKTADDKEIQKAYRKKMREWHPDSGTRAIAAQNIKDEAERTKKINELQEKAVELNEARETLTDPKKRRIYDSGGSENFNGFDFSSIFRTQETEQKVVTILMKESFCGVEKQVKMKKRRPCSVCKGVGGTILVKCRTCNGTGVGERVFRNMGISFAQNGPCENCDGRKTEPSKKCGACGGKKIHVSEENVSVSIPEGVPSKTGLQMGDESDVVFVIEVKDEKNMKRVKNNLVVNLDLELSYAFGGFIKFVNLDERVLKIKIKRCEDLRSCIKVSGEGFNWNGKKGDLYLVPQWKLPVGSQINLNLDCNFVGENKNGVFEEEPKEEVRKRRSGIEDIFSGFSGFSGFGF
jgi:molecular chaperone DnaJ